MFLALIIAAALSVTPPSTFSGPMSKMTFFSSSLILSPVCLSTPVSMIRSKTRSESFEDEERVGVYEFNSDNFLDIRRRLMRRDHVTSTDVARSANAPVPACNWEGCSWGMTSGANLVNKFMSVLCNAGARQPALNSFSHSETTGFPAMLRAEEVRPNSTRRPQLQNHKMFVRPGLVDQRSSSSRPQHDDVITCSGLTPMAGSKAAPHAAHGDSRSISVYMEKLRKLRHTNADLILAVSVSPVYYILHTMFISVKI
ncbi:hypothetical protein B566_EDAN006592 [Ephemera danica]|nr:hypothetical protein B566_EDAN006592 [Ephemera danica]